MAREQEKRATAAGLQNRQRSIDLLLGVATRRWRVEVARQIQERLTRIVEGAFESGRCRADQPDPPLEMRELVADGECRRGEDPCARMRINQCAKLIRNVDR